MHCNPTPVCYPIGPISRRLKNGFYDDNECGTVAAWKFRRTQMAKTNRKVNKANHGKRPASSKARKARRKKLGV